MVVEAAGAFSDRTSRLIPSQICDGINVHRGPDNVNTCACRACAATGTMTAIPIGRLIAMGLSCPWGFVSCQQSTVHRKLRPPGARAAGHVQPPPWLGSWPAPPLPPAMLCPRSDCQNAAARSATEARGAVGLLQVVHGLRAPVRSLTDPQKCTLTRNFAYSHEAAKFGFAADNTGRLATPTKTATT